MMRTSNLLRWTHNAKNTNNNNKSNTNKNWIHPAEALLHGHVAYLVKFLGSTDVDQPKGIDVVKEGIRKLRFSQQLRKAEGQRTPKVELTVSVDGVAIQEAKAKRILHQYPLHRISYCADDKAEKKFFSFIAKEADSEKHTCYVFVSDKLAEEITLTIGQAFDLAYRRFLETTGREVEGRRQMTQLQEQVERLQRQNNVLRKRLQDLALLVEPSKLAEFLALQGISSLLQGATEGDGAVDTVQPTTNGFTEVGTLINFNVNEEQTTNAVNAPPALNLPPVPPRSFENKNGAKLETASPTGTGSFLESDDDFDPRSEDNCVKNNNARNAVPLPLLSPPPIQPRTTVDSNGGSKDIFGAEPFVQRQQKQQHAIDPFGMDDFARIAPHSPAAIESSELNSTLGLLDRRITEMREGFSRGISFAGDDFNIESLDPLRS